MSSTTLSRIIGCLQGTSDVITASTRPQAYSRSPQEAQEAAPTQYRSLSWRYRPSRSDPGKYSLACQYQLAEIVPIKSFPIVICMLARSGANARTSFNHSFSCSRAAPHALSPTCYTTLGSHRRTPKPGIPGVKRGEQGSGTRIAPRSWSFARRLWSGRLDTSARHIIQLERGDSLAYRRHTIHRLPKS